MKRTSNSHSRATRRLSVVFEACFDNGDLVGLPFALADQPGSRLDPYEIRELPTCLPGLPVEARSHLPKPALYLRVQPSVGLFLELLVEQPH